MAAKLLTFEQGSSDWFEWRQKGITATDAAAICGYSKWGSPLTVYADKTVGRKQTEKTGAQEWGLRIEPLLFEKWRDEHADLDTTTVRRGDCYTDEWRRCSLDFSFTYRGCGTILECKTGRHATDWDPVPQGYYAQVQWQMLVTGFRKTYFSVLIAGLDWFEREVDYDEDFARRMEQTCLEFYNNNVLAHVPPKPTKDSADLDGNALVEIRGAASETRQKEVDKSLYAAFLYAREKMDDAEKVFNLMKNKLQYEMADGSDLVYDGKRIAQYITRMGNESIDKKKLASLHPEIYKEVTKRGGIVSYIKFA